jgi:hypothetical protein
MSAQRPMPFALIVAAVRCQQVEDALRAFLSLTGNAGSDPGLLLYRGAWDHLVDAHWQAQRLQSACEKALGVRDR